ncbi:MAG: ribonuclease D [Dinoroseobacter sp.]|nr:ribonuclease D [Dinoroseobacter sp.]
MNVITTTTALAAFCARAAEHPYITVDTEFLRERTYYAKLCLVQVAYPGAGDDSAVLIDPLAEGMSLDPLIEVFRNPNITKVFHAARQDLEIFFVEYDVLPQPLFDTQVAAMVCGFGEQVGYETLVRKIAKSGLDKTSRFTDWSRRPLSSAQKSYALADVTHLRVIYEFLSAKIDANARRGWVEEELETLLSPETYVVEPQDAWRRVKTRTTSGKFLAAVKTLAEFRETHAQNRNMPRNRVFKDDALLELASTKPGSLKDLGKSRLLLREARKGDIADGIIAAIAEAKAMPSDQYPQVDSSRDRLQVNSALADLLRVLLKAKSEDAGVAQRMIATTAELDELAAGERNGPVLRGWRSEVFGQDALRLCEGEIALGTEGRSVRIVEL